MARTENQALPSRPIAAWLGVRGLCPNCGKGRLFKSYLKPVDACASCGETYSQIHADDGPGWFVMVLNGAIVVPVAISLSRHDVMPDWAVLMLLSILAIGGTLLLLPRAKGIFIALLWRLSKENADGPRD